MPFTPFVLRVLPVNGHCTVSIGVLFISSNSVLSSLHLDFPNAMYLFQESLSQLSSSQGHVHVYLLPIQDSPAKAKLTRHGLQY